MDELGSRVLGGREDGGGFAAAAPQLVDLGLCHVDTLVDARQLVAVVRHAAADAVEDVVGHSFQVLQCLCDLPVGLLPPQLWEDHGDVVGLRGRHLARSGEAQRRGRDGHNFLSK